jgi:hypothetical protein
MPIFFLVVAHWTDRHEPDGRHVHLDPVYWTEIFLTYVARVHCLHFGLFVCGQFNHIDLGPQRGSEDGSDLHCGVVVGVSAHFAQHSVVAAQPQ